MAETPSSGGSGVDIAKLGIEVDSTQPASAAENLDKMTAAADGSINAIDRLAASSKTNSASMGEMVGNTSRAVASTEELTVAFGNRNRAAVRADEVMQSANATLKNKIQLLREEWDAEQAALKQDAESIAILDRETAARQAMILKLKDMVATYNMSTEALMRYRAVQLGAAAEAEIYISQLEAMRVATEKYGVTITNVSQIEKARMDWEASNSTALNAQRIRSINEQTALEESATTSLNAQRIRSKEEQAALEESATASLNAQRRRALNEQAEMEAAATTSLNAQRIRAHAERAEMEASASAALNAQRIRSLNEQAEIEASAIASLNAQRIRSLNEQAEIEESARTALNAQRIRSIQEQAAMEESSMAALNAQRIRSINEQASLEESSRVALGAQRRRALAEQVEAERMAQEEMVRNQIIFEAFKRRTMAENRAEAMRILTEQEQAAVALAEKQAIEEIAWSTRSVSSKIAELERLKAYQANSVIRPETIEASFSSAALKDLPNLARYQKEYAEAVAETSKKHSSAHAPATSFADALRQINLSSSRARSELIVLGHEAAQGRWTRFGPSMMVLAEYTNAASLAFTGMGIATLGALAAVGTIGYEMAKGASELYQFNNTMVLTAGYSGMTRDSLESMAESLKGNVHNQIGTATEMLVELNKTGKFTSDTMQHIGQAALTFQRLSGQSTEQVAGLFAELGSVHGKVFNEMQNRIADWAAKQNETYHFLNAAQYEYIRVLALQGRNQEAIIEITDRMNESMQVQDKNVGYLMASYLGFKQIIQEIGHAMREWGKADTTGQLLEAAKSQLRVIEAAGQKYSEEDAASPTPGKSSAAKKYQAIAAAYAKQVQEVMRLQKQFESEGEAADKKAREKQVDAEGVYGQRELDYIRNTTRQKTQIADQYVERLMEGVAKANASKIQAWVKENKISDENYESEMAKAIANGKLKIDTEETIARDIENIRKRYHNPEVKTTDDGRYQNLQEEIDHQNALYKEAEKATNANEKALEEAHKAGIIIDETYYATLRAGRADELRALEASHNAQIAALQKFGARTAVERAKIAKQISQLNDAYEQKRQDIEGKVTGFDQSEENDKLEQYKDIMDAVAKSGAQETEDLDKRIAKQREHNDEIGKNAEQRAAVKAQMEEEQYQQEKLDAAYLQSIIDQGEWDDSTKAVFTARLVWLQRSIEKHEELNRLLKDGAALEAQAAIDKKFDHLSNKIGDDIANAVADGGGRGADRLIRDLKSQFAKLVLRPIIQPLANGFASMIYPEASNAFNFGSGPSAGGSELGSYIGMANSASNLYKMLSSGTVSVGSGIAGAGTALGSSSMNAFGAGMAGAAPGAGSGFTTMSASEIYSSMGMTGEASSASAGATAGSIGTVAAGVAAGILAGRAISGQFEIAGSKNAAPIAGAAAGTYIGYGVGGMFGAAVGAALGGTIGGLLNRAFGMGDKEVRDTGIVGTVSSTHAAGDTYTKWHQDGGWFRGDKDGVVNTAFDTAAMNSLTAGFNTMKSVTTGLAKDLDIGAAALDNYSKTFNVSFGKDAKDMNTAITDLMKDIGDEMASTLIPNVKDFAQSGETASQTLERLSKTFKQTNAIADLLGRSVEDLFGGKGLSSDAARERLIQLAGGSDNLNSYVGSYAQNYLTEAEKLTPVTKAVTAAMSELGLANVTTRDQFKSTISALNLANEADAKLFVSLMQLQDAFATVHPADPVDEANAVMTVTDAKNALKDAYDREVEAMTTARDKMDSFAKSLHKLSTDMLIGDMSPLTPEQKYTEAKSQFDDTVKKAQAGDEDAQANFQSALENFLSASREVNASGDQYSKDFAYAQHALSDTEKWAKTQVNLEQASLDALKAQVSGLIDVNNSINSVVDAIHDLAKSMNKPEIVDQSNEKALMALYESLLHRTADPAGLKFWEDAMKNGSTLTDIAKDFTKSDEYNGKATYHDPVADLYQQIFGRDPDTAGLKYWDDAYAKGMSLNDIKAQFMSSSEYAQKLSSQNIAVGTMSGGGSSVVSAINALQSEVAGLRADQNKQTGDTITGIVRATEESANTIAQATVSTAKNNQFVGRVQPA